MPTNALATISPQPDSQSSDAIVRRWIVAIAELCGKVLTPPLVQLWCELLADIDPSLLDRALGETAKTCGRFFPTPGEVRGRIDRASANALELEAQSAWELALKVAERDGSMRELDVQSQHAVRAAGGFGWIESCPREELQWARKRFIDDYKLIHETGQEEYLLAEGDAENILRRLAAGSKQPKPRELSPARAPVLGDK